MMVSSTFPYPDTEAPILIAVFLNFDTVLKKIDYFPESLTSEKYMFS